MKRKILCVVLASIMMISSCSKQDTYGDPLKNESISNKIAEIIDEDTRGDSNDKALAETTKASTTTEATTATPKEDLTNPVCLEYFLWDNYEKTYTDGSESITFAYQEPDGGGGLRSTYPDIQYIANFRPGTELHFRVYKDREEAIARGVRIKFETNDMILCGYQDADVTYGGHINGVGYDTNFEWSYDGSLIEENFQVIFRNCAVIGMNPYIKVTISADGYKNKTFNIKVNRAENYYYQEYEESYSPDFYAGFTQVYSGEDEYTPRIVLNSDGTFGFLCNHLYAMVTYLGTWDYTMEGRDTFNVRMHVTSNNRYESVNAEISNTTMYLKFKSGEEYAEFSDDSDELYGYAVFGESSMPNCKFHIDYLEPAY